MSISSSLTLSSKHLGSSLRHQARPQASKRQDVWFYLKPSATIGDKGHMPGAVNSGPLELLEEGFEEDRMDSSTPPANEIL